MHPGNHRAARALRIAANHGSLLLVLLAYLALRLPVLEADPPAFERFTYQTLDEMYYALVAYEWHRLPLRGYENLPFNLLQNVVVFLSTTIAGWSYASVRMGALVPGGLGLLFVYLAYLRHCPPELREHPLARNLLFAAGGLALVTSPAFHHATVILEPSISVALYTATVLLALSVHRPSPWIAGAVVASGPLVFYPHALGYMAGAATAVLLWLNLRPLPVLRAAGGAALLVLIFLCGFIALYPMEWREAVDVVASFGKSRVVNVASYPWAYLLEKYLQMFPRMNLFRHSPLLLPVAAGAVAVVLAYAAHAALRLRLPPPAVLAALGMLGARLVLLFLEKTHYERKTTDMAFVLLFLMLFAGGLVYVAVLRLLRGRRPRAAGAIAAAAGLLPLAAVAAGNVENLRGELRTASFHNREALAGLARQMADCTAVGEWGIGLAAENRFPATLNLYRYAATVPPSTAEYNAELLSRLREPDAVVVSTEPPSPYLSAAMRQALVPVYRFQFRTGKPAPDDFAVYVADAAIKPPGSDRNCAASRLSRPR